MAIKQRDLSNLPDETPLRKAEVLSIIPVSRATWDNGVKSGKYPKPIYFGPKLPTWPLGLIKQIASTGGAI